jgi:hypothetical protein
LYFQARLVPDVRKAIFYFIRGRKVVDKCLAMCYYMIVHIFEQLFKREETRGGDKAGIAVDYYSDDVFMKAF